MDRLRRFLPPFTPVSCARVTFLLDYHLDSVIPEHSQYYFSKHLRVSPQRLYLLFPIPFCRRPSNMPTNIVNLIY